MFPVYLLCRVMEVTRSRYYFWRNGGAADDKETEAARQVRECFWLHRRRYGSRRISAELKRQGLWIGRCRVRSEMRRQGLEAIRPKRFRPQTTDSSHSMRISPNLLLDGANKPAGQGTVIVGDITYLPLINGKWCYLATFQDKLTKRIVGWKVAASMTADIVVDAMKKALEMGRIKHNAIIHTDRGSQYASNEYRRLLANNNLRQSMSRKGNCYDNAQAESFFSRFKAELLEGGLFENTGQARSETFSYIEGYYNRVRIHSSLGYQSPEEFEKLLKSNKGAHEVLCPV